MDKEYYDDENFGKIALNIIEGLERLVLPSGDILSFVEYVATSDRKYLEKIGEGRLRA